VIAPRPTARLLPLPPSQLTLPKQVELQAPPTLSSAPAPIRQSTLPMPPVAAPAPIAAPPPVFGAAPATTTIARTPAQLSAPAGFSTAPPAAIASAAARPVTTTSAGFDTSPNPSKPRSAAPSAASAGFGSAGAATSGSPTATKTGPASAGFGSAPATAQTPPQRQPAPASTSAFGSATAAEKTTRPAAAAISAPTAIEILHKPRPLYTAEARAAKIEGEVVLEVLFSAAGTSRVLRVIRPLGYGLERAATAAAEQIRFRPATDGTRPVDTTATVRIAFQLAY
jgi:TonB family protein